MVKVICSCGGEAEIKVVTVSEPDPEVRERYMGHKMALCRECCTATVVDEKFQKMLDEAAEDAVITLEEKEKHKKGPLFIDPKASQSPN